MKGRIKKTFICKFVKEYSLDKKLAKKYIPKAGDVAIFQVIDMGKNTTIQTDNGTSCYLFPGDFIMGAFANRYATDQFEAYVPHEYHRVYHILTKGGAIGIVRSMHEKYENIGPTKLKIIGYVVNKKGDVINTKYLQTKELTFNPKKKRPFKIVLSLGSSMNSGKTTTAGYVCRGLSQVGIKTYYIKLTGTVNVKDKKFVYDCGASGVSDFSDFGFPSTYLATEEELLNLYETLLNTASTENPKYVVVEIADGLLQKETNFFITNPHFMKTVSHVVFSGCDSMGALQGIDYLKSIGITPVFVSGTMTASPLLIEEVKKETVVPILKKEDVSQKEISSIFFDSPPIRYESLTDTK